MLDIFLVSVVFAAGYAGSIYSWPTVRVWAQGSAAEVTRLRAKASALEAALRSK